MPLVRQETATEMLQRYATVSMVSVVTTHVAFMQFCKLHVISVSEEWKDEVNWGLRHLAYNSLSLG
jgi:hypothetical protein